MNIKNIKNHIKESIVKELDLVNQNLETKIILDTTINTNENLENKHKQNKKIKYESSSSSSNGDSLKRAKSSKKKNFRKKQIFCCF